MRNLTTLISLFIFINNAQAQTYGSGVTDIDGNTYTTVIIGTQEWMASNLRTSRYNNGDPIPNVTNDAAWWALTSGAWSNYNNNSSNDAIYGKLYNWFAVDDSRQLCPTGWEIPSNEDLDSLASFLGGGNWQGGKLKEVGFSHWLSPNTGATDQYGFSLLPAGSREDGLFADIGNYGYIWSTWASHPTTRKRWEFRRTQAAFFDINSAREDGYSCRCLKISTPLPVKLTEFNAACKDDLIHINWTTASEINNDYFTIERSTDAINFETIGTVNGNGNSSVTINYSWTDDSPINGTAYYRLKQTDFNGAFEYHGIRTVACEPTTEISIYPNPFEDSFTISLSENTSYPITVEVMDYLGRKIYTQIIENATTEIVLEDKVSAGTYFVKVFNETTLNVERIVKTN